MNDKLNKSVPRTMATQHPDNANLPFWSDCEVIDGDAEVFEAYYAYSALGCQEVMWDAEGKDVDTRVIRKLLQRHWEYFSRNTIGEDIYLTYRIPNPKIEGAEKKYLLETLQNIPVACDVASLAYKRDVVPIFEVILPFTTEAKELIMLFNYYKRAVVANEDVALYGSTTTRDWIGDFKPKAINIIPLVEDFDSILRVDKIIRPYIKAVKPRNLRVFIARSDPALNYGLLCAILLSKIALSKLRRMEKEQNMKIHPILGAGSKPFRGHLSPENIDNFLQEYKGLSTVTIQSAFRYDYPTEQVKTCIRDLNQRLPNGDPEVIERHEEKALYGVLVKCRRQYEIQIEALAPLINSVAAYVPRRRARKLHIGLFGYSRCVAGVCLPRAISFATALYSIGLPPEFIGMKVLNQLKDDEWALLKKHYLKMDYDLRLVGEYVSFKNIGVLIEMSHEASRRANMDEGKLKGALSNIVDDLKTVEEILRFNVGPKGCAQRKHENFVNNFLIAFLQKDDDEAEKALIESAKIRKCLG